MRIKRDKDKIRFKQNYIRGKQIEDYISDVAIEETVIEKINETTYTKEEIDEMVDQHLDGYTKSQADELLDEKADKTNTYTINEVNRLLTSMDNEKADKSTTYTKTEVNNLFTTIDNTKADKSDTYTKSEVNTIAAEKADKSDTYTKTQADALYNEKADKSDTYTKSETDAKLLLKANQATTYTKTEVDDMIAGVEVDAYTKAQTNDLLATKADQATTYTKTEVDTIVSDATEPATDSKLGTVKTDTSKSISLDEDGKLVVGGRLGQFPNGGVFYPDTIEPTEVKASTFMLTDGAKYLSLGSRTFGIMAGVNLTCKSAAAGTTQYRLSNTQTNRFACFACKGGRVAIDQTDAQTNGTALMTDISFANGNPISAYFGPTESDNDIIITVDRTVNPSASTTKLRMYGTSTSSDVIIVGQGNGVSGGKAISLGQACHAGGNQCIAFGNSSLSLANNSVAFGHTHLVNKQFCFCAGQGHDFTNGSNGAAAVGICSEISSNTAFAVGNGIFNGNGNITRSNALEVLNDGRVKSSGTPTDNDDLTTKAYVDNAIGGGLEVTTYGNTDFTYQQVLDPDTQEVINECVPYSTVSGNANEPKAVKYGRMVNLCGAFKNINARPDNAAFVMGKVPTGCEPLYVQNILVQGTSQYKFLLTIATDGTLTCQRYSASASAVAVPNNAWLNINATYISAS